MRARVQCFGYEIAGAILLLFLLFVSAIVMLVVLWGVRRKIIMWQQITAMDAARDMKEAWTESKGKGIVHRVRVTYAAYLVLNVRGEWAANEKTEEMSETGNTILDTVGSFFDGVMGGVWWY